MAAFETLAKASSMRNRLRLPRLRDPDAGLAETVALLRERDLIARRRALRSLAGAAVLASPVAAWACSLIPQETEGPYPGDGTNGPNVLTQTGILRSDIRSSFGSAGTTVAAGTPLSVRFRLVNVDAGCAPLAGYAVYAWHCDAQGRYSMYSSGVTTQNYLRGVQVSDANGEVTFTAIFPGAYAGRWPHIHFEVYETASLAISGRNALRTSQLALPDAACRTVYAQTSLYPSSLTNHNRTPLASDGIFADDGAALQMASVTGSVAEGFVATLDVGIAGVASTTQTDINQNGLTGTWYEPASSGQGIALEVYQDMPSPGQGYLHGGWFTFDVAPAGGVDKQRWYTFSGAVQEGLATATLPIYRNIGGNFNTAPVTASQQVGSATIRFASCTAAELSYTFTDGSARSGTVALARLAPNVTCTSTATVITNADHALSGNWFDPATSGQGFIVEVNPAAPVVFFAWYTYAVGGQSLGVSGQRWYTGQGAYAAGSRSTTLTLYETTGGIFDANTPASQATTAVGSATLSFDGCDSATLAYAFTGGGNAGQSGTIALSRVGPVPPGCVA